VLPGDKATNAKAYVGENKSFVANGDGSISMVSKAPRKSISCSPGMLAEFKIWFYLYTTNDYPQGTKVLGPRQVRLKWWKTMGDVI
jgi:hypothetical protein